MSGRVGKMDKFEMIKACKEHFKYNDIIDEMREIIDWGSIVEFIYSKIGQKFFEEVAKEE
jgi:hypothetical protein